jgi:hypothetical protein
MGDATPLVERQASRGAEQNPSVLAVRMRTFRKHERCGSLICGRASVGKLKIKGAPAPDKVDPGFFPGFFSPVNSSI